MNGKVQIFMDKPRPQPGGDVWGFWMPSASFSRPEVYLVGTVTDCGEYVQSLNKMNLHRISEKDFASRHDALAAACEEVLKRREEMLTWVTDLLAMEEEACSVS